MQRGVLEIKTSNFGFAGPVGKAIRPYKGVH